MGTSYGVVIVRLIGGLGNQLFGYAAARRLSLKNNAELVIDDVTGFKYDKKYRRQYQLHNFKIPCRKANARERLEPASRIRRYLLREINKSLPFEQRRYIQQEGVDFDPRLLQVVPSKALYLEGYWQSEGYFKDVEDTIRQDLQIKPPYDSQNLSLAEEINARTSVAVHVRFFENPKTVSVNNASGDYYQRAVKEMEKRVPNAHYYLFSDQPENAKKAIPVSHDRLTIVDHNKREELAFADLWLMTQCQNFIIANSTFSWWGAWLSEHFNKTVIVPGFEVREGVASWGFRGLIPEGWIKC